MRGDVGIHKIVGLTGSFVPYHHARWQAFAENHPGSCVVIELTDKDPFSVLEFSAGKKTAYDRITLFPGRPGAEITAHEIGVAISRKLEELNPDCVCLNGYASPLALFALAWCAKNRVPTVMMSESTEWDESRKAWKEWVKSRLIGLCSSALVGGTPHAEYMAKLGMPMRNIFLGYDVVDNGYFQTGAANARAHADELRERHALPENYLLACARFTPKKNLQGLLEAYRLFRASAPVAESYDLVVMGDGPGRSALFELRTRLGLESHVHFVGAKTYEDLPTYYGLASAFIHASTTEQWGLVVNEAMASGLPVLVSSRCGCSLDLVREGVNGFTFDPFNRETFAGKMMNFIDANLPALGRASQQIVAEWSPQRFSEGLTHAVASAFMSGARSLSRLDRVILQIVIRR